jgi:hypothetical protein
LLYALILLLVPNALGLKNQNNRIIGYYTRLPFDDRGFTGEFADIVIDLQGKWL